MAKKIKRNKTKTIENKGDDKSPFIYQEKKLDFELNIREFPWTEKQKAFIEIGLHKDTNYIFSQSPAGTGKTLLAVYVGLRLLKEGSIKTILFVRNPVESSSHGLGYLSGDFETKMSPYSQPMMDHLNELLPPAQIKLLLSEGFVQSIPLGFLKGRTFNCSLIIADEVEDMTVPDFRLVMSRLGKRSKMILIGDQKQTNVRNSGFERVFDIFDSPECVNNGIYCLPFLSEDIMRNKVLGYVIDRFELIRPNQ